MILTISTDDSFIKVLIEIIYSLKLKMIEVINYIILPLTFLKWNIPTVLAVDWLNLKQ